MPYSIAIGSIQVIPEAAKSERAITCNEARKGCTPSFVFSINGQVGFRHALEHMTTCKKRECASLRKKVRESMHKKLQWLFQEEALLGCVQLQPFLYREKRSVNMKEKSNFSVVANHLAHCPQEGCARLRRSFLLTIRDRVSPAQKNEPTP